MTRQDPGAATGQQPREPVRCRCSHLEGLHVPAADGSRGKCWASVCGCRVFRPAGDKPCGGAQ